MKQPEPDHFHIYWDELRIYFNQTRFGDCCNSGKTDQDGFVEFYFLSGCRVYRVNDVCILIFKHPNNDKSAHWEEFLKYNF